jgi:hypothetical protein
VQSRVSGEGWNDDTIARALASTRLVAAAAIGHTISQREAPLGGVAAEGRLLVQHGLLRKTAASVSASATADDVGRARAQAGAFSTTRQQQLEGLQSGLSVMTAALYRQEPNRAAPALDESIRHAVAVAREITAERGGWRRWARR